MPDFLLQITGLTKFFGPVQALDEVHLGLRPGEIHALMGENGAGKSTLIKVLTGVYPADAGRVEFQGRLISPRSPADAETLGISTVYQEINLVPTLSIADNIALGRQPTRWGCIRWRAVHQRARTALQRLGLNLDTRRLLGSCSMAEQQLVAIARALDVEARLLILDEPTSSLDEQEVQRLFDIMRRLRGEGLALLFVTHFLDQVYDVSDRITVLRNGRHVLEHPADQLPRLQLVSAMIGREFQPQALSPAKDTAPTESSTRALFQARQLARRAWMQPIDLELRAGEILGLSGLLGSGRTETAKMLFGLAPADRGEIRLEDKPVSIHSPRQAIRLGLAFCSEDRKTEGLLPNLSVRENIILAMQASRGPLRRVPSATRDTITRHYIDALNIKTPSPVTPVRNLSGGNQQKVLLARWLALQPRLILLDEPTRGIDVGAKAEIEKLVLSLRDRGLGVLYISSDLEEIVRTCQRVAILRDRRKIGELSGSQINEHQIMSLIAHHDA